jgi:carboxymethylenebutenolidase
MCFDLDSRPPIAPIAGGALDGARIELTATDGNRFSAFRARASAPTGAGMLILPDVRGLHPFFEELALRFAERGVDAITIDYFGRTAGTSARGDDFDHSPHVEQTTWDGLTADIRAGVAALRDATGDRGGASHIFTMGFCMGGRLAFDSASLGLGLAGVVGFYGWPVGPHRNGSPAPADIAASLDAPILGIFGGADQGINAGVVAEFDQALTRAGVDHRLIVYPGAPHSFFDRKATEYAAASAAAWDETLAFIEGHTA